VYPNRVPFEQSGRFSAFTPVPTARLAPGDLIHHPPPVPCEFLWTNRGIMGYCTGTLSKPANVNRASRKQKLAGLARPFITFSISCAGAVGQRVLHPCTPYRGNL